MEAVTIGVLALLAIAGAAWLGPRVRIAAPLLLVLVGIAVSAWPSTPYFIINPEWILAGILPPLVYSAAVSMPTMEFRRDLAAISGLAVILVVITSFLVGWLMSVIIPGIGFATGLALGAIVSPTDAVATSIVKRMGVSSRTVVVLEGESLLNDASALVLLRTAIGAMAASLSLWHLAADFVYAVIVATIIGLIVGNANLRIRSHASDPTVNTVISLTVPFMASVPADIFGASGLVAAVVAGLVTGFLGPRFLPPNFRLSDKQNWRTLEFVLEGSVFLIMGLEMEWVLRDVQLDHYGVATAMLYAGIALFAVMAIRTVYVIPLVYAFRAGAARIEDLISTSQQRLEEPIQRLRRRPSGKNATALTDDEVMDRFKQSWRRRMADIEYFRHETVGWRDGSIIVWAGMRGAVTLAAAQTLPTDTPSRSLLIFIAFLVASLSLLVQGSTLPWLVRKVLRPSAPDGRALQERLRLAADLRNAGLSVVRENGLDVDEPFPELAMGPVPPTDLSTIRRLDSNRSIQLQMIEAQRQVLIQALKDGVYSTELINASMANLDADQIALEIKVGTPEH